LFFFTHKNPSRISVIPNFQKNENPRPKIKYFIGFFYLYAATIRFIIKVVVKPQFYPNIFELYFHEYFLKSCERRLLDLFTSAACPLPSGPVNSLEFGGKVRSKQLSVLHVLRSSRFFSLM
jgi:hypothetical protein